MPESVLAVTDVHTYYGDSHVLHGVSLGVAAGEVVAILGRNGMGKTTLIRSIVGFTAPRRSRKYFGALLLAVRAGKSWKYAGRAGTGFDAETLHSLHRKMVPMITKTKPIAAKVPSEAATTWVKPKLVAEVKFTEWTAAGEMRHPVFLGLRTDKKTTEVTRERPRPLRKVKP